MKVTSEKGGGRLAHLEGLLQELTRCEENKRQHSVAIAAAATKQKLLSSRLLQAQEELAAAQASKTKLCEEVGVLKQTKENQARQLSKYKLDIQASRELHAAMSKKMEKLQESTRTAKQQYIRSLASRVKTSALVLQQLNASSGSSFSFELTEKCSEWKSNNPNKRKRVAASEDGEHRASAEGSKHTGSAAESELRPSEAKATAIAGAVDAAETQNAAEQRKPWAGAQVSAQQTEDCAQNERAIEDLETQVAQLESKYSALNDKYKALDRDHNELLADSKSTALDIKAKDSKIEELMQMLEISRSKQQDKPATSDEEGPAMEGRLKLLEDNLAQMNGYADQLEMVIAQCPACTIKLQNESTQDSVTRAE